MAPEIQRAILNAEKIRKKVDDIIKREQLPDDHPLVEQFGRRYGTVYSIILNGE